MSRWFAVGQGSRLDSHPGSRAADQALVGDDAKLLVVFCSQSQDMDNVVQEIDDRSGGVPLIGCSTAGEIATSGPGDAGVVIAALGGSGFSATTALAVNASKDRRKAGADVARGCIDATADSDHRLMLLLPDGLAGDQQEILRGVYAILGAEVPLVGGCAGDDLEMKRTFQLYGDSVHTDAVVAAMIGSEAPLGVGVRHGWRSIGEPMLVTESLGNRICSLDGRPALDVYLDRLGLFLDKDMTAGEVVRITMAHPLGLATRTGEPTVRLISAVDFEERALVCFAEVHNDSLVWMMAGDRDSVLMATDAACDEALGALGDRRPLGLFAFDGIGRRAVLGDQGMKDEIGRISHRAVGAPIAGFYSYGEIARTRGPYGFNSQTLVVMSLA